MNPLQAASPEKLRDLTADEVQKIQNAVPEKPTVRPAKPRKILVFWRCEGFYHKSIPVVNEALKIMGRKTGAYEVAVCTDDYSIFTPAKLRQFDAVCLNNTTHLKFHPQETPERCKALMDFVKGGKGLIGIHAATDNFYNVGTGVKTTIKELAEMILELTGSDLKIKYEPAGMTFVKNRIGNPVKAEKEVGFKYSIELKEGLQRLIEWRESDCKA